MSASEQAPVPQYQIGSDCPASHRFQVVLTIPAPDPAGQVLWLPDWIPGSYMIRDFARNLFDLQAEDGAGRPVDVQALDKSTWRCAPVAGVLQVRYEVYAWDLSVRSAHLDQTHGYFNATSLCLAVAGQERAPAEVLLQAPAGQADWRVATTLPALAVDARGFGRYRAADYDALIDHPVEMGTFDERRFSVRGVPHRLAVTGRHRGDLDRLVADLTRICAAQIDFFGQPAPFDEYLFQLTVVGQGYGGLEHRSSTSLICSRDSLPSADEPAQPGAAYVELLGLCSHEYFHSWNVKRLKPVELLAPDLQREVHTELLWFFEGVTSYYDDLFLVRAGCITPARWLELLGKQLTRHLRTPGRWRQTVAQSSFDAWTRYYKQDENTPNEVVSYYLKGALVALCLDLSLRAQTGERASLDRLMQWLWQRCLGGEPGVDEALLRQWLQAQVGDALSAPLTAWLHGTEELPWQALLAGRGIDVRLSASEPVTLGVRTQAGEGGVALTLVTRGSAAEAGGLSAGDVVVAIDGLRVSADQWNARLARYRPGDTVQLQTFRRDEWRVVGCTLQAGSCDTCELALMADPAAVRLAGWLTAS